MTVLGAQVSRLKSAWARLSGQDRVQAQLVQLEARVDRLMSERAHPQARAYYYLGGGRALSFLSDGMPMYVYTADRSISPWIISQGVWETFVDDILMDLCQPGMGVCDIGANQGYYTLKFARKVGAGGRVLSLEPNPSMHALLCDSVELNGLRGWVQVHNAAAGAQAGELRMTYNPDYPGGGHLFEQAADGDHRQVDVRVLRVDDVIWTDRSVDLVKVDVEGWEPHVFQGMEATLARNPQAPIVTELSWEQWSKAGAPAELLKRVAGPSREVFAIHGDATLERVDLSDSEAFHRAGTMYALIAAWNDDTQQRVGRRLRR